MCVWCPASVFVCVAVRGGRPTARGCSARARVACRVCLRGRRPAGRRVGCACGAPRSGRRAKAEARGAAALAPPGATRDRSDDDTVGLARHGVPARARHASRVRARRSRRGRSRFVRRGTRLEGPDHAGRGRGRGRRAAGAFRLCTVYYIRRRGCSRGIEILALIDEHKTLFLRKPGTDPPRLA